MHTQPAAQCQCMHDHGIGMLLVDIDTEKPQLDCRGNWQYYCLLEHHLFTVRPTEIEVAPEENTQKVVTLV
ncbi:hypothetical protein KDA_63550 [Dictyobacter alpinus]|uniref:Uncharacterized protein n=1 Tax=Dictyobacter alpinus TaxID=2014873 RepID=A0A402BHI4_9CHLR|nr:hypothetical protein [Dictyobacter alpinus]GCE30871.1 hypothetical protein KDA_63550 [Dictyobacter alpinus]